jgi:hypothetical protein
MSDRYWITGVQLGLLVTLEHKNDREDLINLISNGQYIGKKGDLKRILKLNEALP